MAHKTNRLQYLVQLLLIFFQIGLLIIFGFRKQGYHIDEILTYSLSNAYYLNRYKNDSEAFGKWVDTEYFTERITVSAAHRFAYGSVFFNQKEDVHPPFFYGLLHTVSSLFPETFSKWFGLSLNILLFILVQVFLFLLSQKIFNQFWIALLTGIFWGFSAGGVSTVMFIRMYMALTAFVVLVTYFNVVLVQEPHNGKALTAVLLCSVLGTLTHYYFLIYLAFLAIATLFFLFVNRSYATCVRYLAALFVAGGISLFIFPPMWGHIFRGYRGVASFESFLQINQMPGRVVQIIRLVGGQQFGGFLSELGILCVVVLFLKTIDVLYSLWLEREPQEDHKKIWNVLWQQMKDLLKIDLRLFSLICFPVALSLIMVAQVAPLLTTRYYYFLYPLIALLSVIVFCFVGRVLFENKLIIMTFVLAVLLMATMPSYRNQKVEYLRESYQQVKEVARKYQGLDCVFITDHSWVVNSNLLDLKFFDEIYLVKGEQTSTINTILAGKDEAPQIIVYIDKALNSHEILEKLLDDSHYYQSRPLFETEFTTAYLID